MSLVPGLVSGAAAAAAVAALVFAATAAIPRATEEAPREAVVLVHGLGRTTRCFSSLEKALGDAGFRAISWGYESFSGTFETHARRLAADLAKLDADESVSRVHCVGHSLGAIVVRAALLEKKPAKMGRCVQLAPPNRGSVAARRLAPLFGRLVPVLPELSDEAGSAVRDLGVPEGVEIGVVVARYDHLVREEGTRLPGEGAGAADTLVVDGTHTFLMNRPDVIAATIRFLRTGRFRPS